MKPIPRGMEILVKKAAVDADFRGALLREHAAAADRIGLVLEPAEREMLNAIPSKQLEHIIGRTKVPAAARAAFMGYAASAMLAAVATTAPIATATGPPAPTGINPDLIEKVPRTAEKTGSLAGTCLEVGGQPAGNVRVEILGTDFKAVTAPDGFFKIDGIPVGTYDVRVSGGAYAARTLKDVEVRDDDVTTVAFTLETIGEGGARPDMPEGL